MSYCYENGLQCGTQFHPENLYYHKQDYQGHNRNWIDNFFHFSGYHQKSEKDMTLPSVDKYVEMVNDRLNLCKNNPFSILDGEFAEDTYTLMQLIDAY
jgi:hypothetical protein